MPATIITSDWRGEKRMTSAPNRAMSKRLEAVAMSSMAQHASPIGMGHNEFVRIQLIAASARVTITSPSILLLYPSSVFAETMSSVQDVNHPTVPARKIPRK